MLDHECFAPRKLPAIYTIHDKFQILTQRNKLLLFLTARFSEVHIIDNVTGGGPMEAPIVVPALKYSAFSFESKYHNRVSSCT